MLKVYDLTNGCLDEIVRFKGATCAPRNGSTFATPATTRSAASKSRSDIELSPVNDYEPFQVSSHFSATETQLTMTGLLLILNENGDPHLVEDHLHPRQECAGDRHRWQRPKASRALVKECENCFTHRSGRDDIFAAILDMIVDHTDNILDKVGHDLDRINTMVFQHHATTKTAAHAARLAAAAEPPARAHADRTRA